MLKNAPAVPFLLAIIAFYGVTRYLLPVKASEHFPEKRIDLIAGCCGAITCLALIMLLIVNILHGTFIWHDEPNILSIAAATAHDQPMYHAVNSPHLYSLLYGPMTFLVYMPLLWHIGVGLERIEFALAIVTILTGLTLYSILRQFLSTAESLACIAFPLAALIPFSSALLGIRADIWLLLSLALATRFSLSRNSWVALIATGIASGIAINFKLTAAPMAVLAFLLLYRKHGWKNAALSIMVALGVALLPFASHLISLKNYITWLSLSAHQGFMKKLLFANLAYSIFLIAPVLFAHFLLKARPRNRNSKFTSHLLGWAAGIALLAALTAGSKNGAGSWHLWQLLPFLVFLLGSTLLAQSNSSKQQNRQRKIVIAAIAFASLVTFLRYLPRAFKTADAVNKTQLVELQMGYREIMSAIAAHPKQQIGMAYGKHVGDLATAQRYQLVLHGEAYVLDENAVWESLKAREPFPSQIITASKNCSPAIWVVPHNNVPFDTAVISDDAGDANSGKLFPIEFTDSVLKHYYRISIGKPYDLWGCSGKN